MQKKNQEADTQKGTYQKILEQKAGGRKRRRIDTAIISTAFYIF